MYRLKKISLKNAKPGMQVGRMVLTDENKVIISEGTILNDILIGGLNAWNIKEIFIREEISSGQFVFPRDFSARKTKAQQQFSKQYDETLDLLKSAFHNIRCFNEVPIVQMKELSEYSVEYMVSTPGIINYMNLMHKKDDFTFQHSINVSTICGVLGKWMGFTGKELKDLIMTGLLHDVGKNRISLDILNKPSQQLTTLETETIKQHPIYGYQMVYQMPEFSHEMSLGILQHHERIDGSGYPLGVKENKISKMAKIIAIADTYDTIISDAADNQNFTPYEAVDRITQAAFEKLDPEAAVTFINNVKNYFIGNIVFLNDGREAEIIYMSNYLASQPIVYARNGEVIDLEKRKDLRITGVKKGKENSDL